MARHFSGGMLVFDATTKKGLKNMLKTWLKDYDDNSKRETFSSKVSPLIKTLKTGFVMVLCHQITGFSPARLDYPLCLRVNAKFLRCQCNGSKHLMLRVLLPGRDFSLGIFIILRILEIINLFFNFYSVKSIITLNMSGFHYFDYSQFSIIFSSIALII